MRADSITIENIVPLTIDDVDQSILTPPLEASIEDGIIDSLPDKHRKRVTKALTSDMVVYPETKQVYRVEQYDEDGEIDSSYTVVYPSPNYTHSTCACKDYLFRCAQMNVRCKHQWRVRKEIKAGNIPPVNTSPYDWLKKKVQGRILNYTQRDETPDELDALSSLSEYINEHTKITMNMRYAFLRWQEITLGISYPFDLETYPDEREFLK